MAAILVLLLLAFPRSAAAQTSGLWFEAGAGEARWATAATSAGPLRYGTLALRGRWDPNPGAGVRGRFSAGRGKDAVGTAGWIAGEAGFRLGWQGAGAQGEVQADAWGVRYDQDLRYEAAGVRLVPSLTWSTGPLSFRIRGEGVLGRWRQETEQRVGGPPVPLPIPTPQPGTEDLRGTLSLLGGGVDLAYRVGPGWLRVSPSGYRAHGRIVDDWQRAVEGEAGVLFGPVTLAASARWQTVTPLDDTSRTSGVGFQARGRFRFASNWALMAQVDTRPWDPLHAVERGAAAHVGLEWRWLPVGRGGPPVVELGPTTDAGRTVRFRLRHPRAGRVDLVGDFTGWQPMAMTRRAGFWETSLVVRPGIHHFAFLVDGDVWMVPAHAPGIVEDGWNRRNATLVIPEYVR